MNALNRNTLASYGPLFGGLDGLLNDFLRPAVAYEARAEALPARIDVRETPEAYVVSADLPGAKKEDIHVEIDGNEVAITAETRREIEQKEGEKWLRSERFYGKTGRRFALPLELDEAKAAAKFTDGVLELTLPKKAVATSRKVEVN
ncbi:MAG TPA: Hsp20/alpha crystallin family protein [Usitatibacter sp.]|nr:Hsp20/alpha crystallin family protein [Usitatibacter sp.]